MQMSLAFINPSLTIIVIRLLWNVYENKGGGCQKQFPYFTAPPLTPPNITSQPCERHANDFMLKLLGFIFISKGSISSFSSYMTELKL